jgi:hypothetical protein
MLCAHGRFLETEPFVIVGTYRTEGGMSRGWNFLIRTGPKWNTIFFAEHGQTLDDNFWRSIQTPKTQTRTETDQQRI